MDKQDVFYHTGGVMMDDEHKRRQWENDPSGWYFWRRNYGLRCLHGPYDSRELAQNQADSFKCAPTGFLPRFIQSFTFLNRSGHC